MAESETESMDQQFCLRWNNFQKNISSQFEALRKDEDFVDVTLACGGRYLGAHKVVLSACSPYFKQLFKVNPCQHPIFFMRDVELQHVKALLEYMYTGEVNIAQTDMPLFLRTAETLQIRGLTDTNNQPDAVCDKPKSTLNAGDRLQTHPSIDNTSRDESKTPNTIDQRHRPFKNKRLDETNRFVESYYNPLTTAPGSAAKRQCPNDVREKDRHSDVLNRLNAQSPTSHTDNDINFIAGKLHTEMDIQPKVEMADYATDEESHQDDLGLMNAEAFLGLQDVKGGLSTEADCKPGTSHNLDHVPNAVEARNENRKLHSLDPRPCPICGRIYSNLSNLRQHIRLIHNPQGVVCALCNKPFKTKLYLRRHMVSYHHEPSSIENGVVISDKHDSDTFGANATESYSCNNGSFSKSNTNLNSDYYSDCRHKSIA